ncbi:MAG: GHMP kinase [Ruminococcus sp.]|nr:GHMP kinase [Candidatus Copronaster equi]
MNYSDVKQISEKWGVPERRVTALCRNNRIIGAKKEGKSWLIPDDAELPLDGRTKEAVKEKSDSLSNQTTVGYTTVGARARAFNEFINTYDKEPKNVAFTPYRICPIGAHSDHNLGKITGFAIDKGIYIAYGPKMNGVIEIKSLQFPKRAQWHVMEVPKNKENDWADHLRGATIALNARYPLRIGLCAVIDGELPIGGLSSSAAVIITFLSALSALNNITLTPAEMITISKEAENKYVGVSCGKLDQSCEVYCRKNQLLYLDTKDDSFELIPTSPDMKPYEIAIFFSGLERSLASSKFNMRVDECRSAAYALMAFAGIDYGKFDETNLRDVPYEIYLKYKDNLPLNWAKRAEHWYTEYQRVQAGAEAWRKGDMDEFGRLSFESGMSSIKNWETGSPELIKLYEIMTHTKGIYGGRFSGAGFKGCCMALIDPAYEKEILEQVEREYLDAFPNLKGKYSAHICHTADGVRL